MDQLMERNNMPKISYIRTYITGTSTGTEPVYRIDSFLPNSSKEIKIYVCSGFTCKNPVSTLDELKEILG